MARSPDQLNAALGLTDDADGTETATEYHCRITGCDAHFPEKQQAHTHLINDHSYAEQVRSLVGKRSG